MHAWRKSPSVLTATVLTDEAEAIPGDKVLGPWFEWDSELCVREYHEQQAGALIRSVVVVQLVPAQTEPVRAFAIVANGHGKHYEHITQVIAEPDKRKGLIQQVRQEKQAFDDKLNELIALLELV